MDHVLAAQDQRREGLNGASVALVDIADDAIVRGTPFVLRVTQPVSGFLGVGRTAAELAQLRETAIAFLGRTYGEVSWTNIRLSADDAVQGLLVNAGYTWGFEITRRPEMAPATALEVLREQLVSMMDLLSRARVVEHRPRSVAHHLRDLERCLQTGDDVGFEEHIRALRGLGRLSEDALRFLEVRRVAAFGQPRELWTSGLIAWLLAVRRPRLITELLLDAIAMEILGDTSALPPSELADRFTRDVLPAYAAAFTGLSHVPEAQGARLLVTLFAATADPPRSDLLEAILADTAAPDHQRLRELAEDLSVSEAAPIVDALVAAADAEARHDFGAVVDLVRDLAPTTERARLLVHAAFESPDPVLASLAWVSVCELDDEQRGALPTSAAFTRRLNWVKAAAAPSAYPADPTAWVEAVLSDPAWDGALEAARAGVAGDWDPSFFQDPPRVDRFAEGLIEAWFDAPDRVVSAVPHLERFARDVTEPAAVRYRLALVQVLAADDQASLGDLIGVVELLEGVLPSALPAETYREVLLDLQGLWERRLASFERLDWGLALVDLVARSPKADPDAMRTFVQSVTVTIERAAHRMSAGELAYVRAVLAECELAELLDHVDGAAAPQQDSQNEGSVWATLADRTLGIHCLFDPIVVRLKSLVLQLSPSTTVSADASHDCSPALRALCTRADLFVLVTQHAKHAASDCVERHVSPRALVKSTQSRVGVTGVLRALEAHLRVAAAA